MRIEAAGKTWIVEERELAPGVGGDRLSGVTYRNERHDDDVLQVRWVVRPPQFTPRVARELFDMAAVRVWRDPRNGRIYRVYLESGRTTPGPAPTSPEAGDPSVTEGERAESVCFQWEGGTVATSWLGTRGLGFVEDVELMALLDRASGI